jgi:hypothetical protein
MGGLGLLAPMATPLVPSSTRTLSEKVKLFLFRKLASIVSRKIASYVVSAAQPPTTDMLLVHLNHVASMKW